MIVSVTERGEYKRCRRRWLINSRNRWGMTRIVQAAPLSLGTLVHSALGSWMILHKEGRTLEPGGLAHLFGAAARDMIVTAKDTYRTQVGSEMSDSELSPLYENVQLGLAMMINYQEFWRKPIQDGFEVIATEQRCMVPIPNTEHTEEWVWEPYIGNDGKPHPYLSRAVKKTYDTPRYHYLEGRLDSILRRKRDGALFVLDHKTYGQRPQEPVLRTTDQFLAYHWMLLALADADESGLLQGAMVAGVAFDGLWKRATPPKIVDGHKGTKADLFSRMLIERPIQELVEFEQMLAAEVLEMASNPPIYHNRTSNGSCFWGCSDNKLCLAMSRGEDVEYRLRREYTLKPTDDMVGAEDESME